LPYDPGARLSVQVAESLASSLEHLGTDYVDSFLLHGPSSLDDWAEDDAEVWEAMCKERDCGRTRFLGVSNISLRQLEQMAAYAEAPAFVQNRCYARDGWDRGVRLFCRERKITYQGFSLLTASKKVVSHPLIVDIAEQANATPAQVVFTFARMIGILPLTGTSSPEHMEQDLTSLGMKFSDETVQQIESLSR
jgi:diketogulonate reductase-like aldo/keto reductase